MPIIEEDTAQWLEFQKGNIDFTSVPVGQVNAAKNMQQVKDGEWTAESYPSVSVYYVRSPATTRASWPAPENLPAAPGARQSADREAVINVVKEGVGVVSDSIVPVTLPGYKAGLNPNPYDPDKAKQTLDDWTAGGGTVPAEIPYWFNSGAGHDKVAEALGAGWETELGIKIALNGIETNSYWTQLSENKAPGLFRMGWGADYPDMANFIYLFTTEGGSYGSYTFYSNPEVDELYEQAGSRPISTRATRCTTRPRPHPRRRSHHPALHLRGLPRDQQPHRRLQLLAVRAGRHVEGVGEGSTRRGRRGVRAIRSAD